MQRPKRGHIVGELLTLLLFVGVEPLRLSEPALPPEDQTPVMPSLTRDDLLAWHEVLVDIEFVTPWEGDAPSWPFRHRSVGCLVAWVRANALAPSRRNAPPERNA